MKRLWITLLLLVLAATSLGCAYGPTVGFEHVICWVHNCGGMRRKPPHSCPRCPYYNYSRCHWGRDDLGADDLLAPAEKFSAVPAEPSDEECRPY